MLSPFPAFANLDCEPLDPRQQVGNKAIQSIDGAAQTLFKAIKGNAAYKSLTESKVKNLYKDYPNADKIVLNGKLIYMFCTYLNSEKDLESNEKFKQLTDFMQLFIVNTNTKDTAISNNSKKVLPVFEKDDIVTELKRCTLKGKKLKCFISITSLEDKSKFTIYAYTSGKHSRVVLSTGKAIFANKVIFAGQEDKRIIQGNLISSVTFEAILFFDGIILEGKKIPLLEIQYEKFSARLRNININQHG